MKNSKEGGKVFTPEQAQEDIAYRTKSANKDLQALLKKWQLGLSVGLGITGDGRVQGQPVFVDQRFIKQPEPAKEQAPEEKLEDPEK